MSLKLSRCAPIVLFPTAAALLAVSSPASAQTGPELTTPFPEVTVEPGAEVRFDITTSTPTTATFGLTVTGLPDGWAPVLHGGGSVVSAVTARPDEPEEVTLEVDVPPDSAAGDYEFDVIAVGADVRLELPLTVTVADEVDNAVELTADFQLLTGAPADTFTYNLTVTNNSPESQTFTFTPSAPQGWSVDASDAAQTRSPTLTIEAGETGKARIEAQPPPTIDAGQYPLNVEVATATGQRGQIQLIAEITGRAELTFATTDERLSLDARAGGATTKTFVVSNPGTADLTDITLSATPPTDWNVTFEPDTIERIAAGSSAEVVATIRPSGRAIAGDYSVGVTARAGSLDQVQALRVTIETSRWWGLVGVGVIVAVVAVLALVYRRFGRR